MIYDAEWRNQFQQYVVQRLSVAHPDLARMAASLRDSTGTVVWTEVPSDQSLREAGKQHLSLEGWRAHYTVEFAYLNQWRTSHGAKLQAYDAQAKTALDGYVVSIPNIGAALSTALAKYKDAQGRVIRATLAQADRDAIAAAIEAELQ